MKITEIEPILLAFPIDFDGRKIVETLVIRVATDTGTVGWGEAFASRGGSTVWEAASTLVARSALGSSAIDIASIAGSIERQFHSVGRNGPLSYALSALDIALWDINAQEAGLPLHRYLGSEASPNGVPAYASLFRLDDPKLVERETSRALQMGYEQIKIHEIRIAEVAAARNVIGPKVPLMLDTNAPWSSTDAVGIALKLVEFDLKWLEEPIWPPEDYDGYIRIRRETGIPLAAGENAGVLGLQQMIRHKIVDYIQPSVPKAGGLSGSIDIVKRARSIGTHLAPHSPYLGPGLVATMHLIAALIPEAAVEHRFCTLEANLFAEPLQLSGGQLLFPEGNGLGVEMSKGFVEKFRIK